MQELPRGETFMPRKRKYKTSYKRVGNVADPNKLQDAPGPEHLAALAPTCKFLGKEFDQGDTICYNNAEWICTNVGWQKTGNSCG